MIGKPLHRHRLTCRLVLTALICASGAAFAQAPPSVDPLSFRGPDPAERFKDISIEQKMDAQVPLDLPFTNESGETVLLREFFGEKPVILTPVYYECPMLCIVELDALEALIGATKFDIGTDYEVVTVSIDPGETPELAAQKKAAHLERLNRPGAEAGWHFLTGEEENIARLADTVGFRYAYDESTDQYAHAAGIILLTPQGRVARYVLGAEYFTKHVEFALMDASEGRIGSVIDAVQWLCFQYDFSTGTYSLAIYRVMQVAAAASVAALILMYTMLYIRSKRKNRAARASRSAGAHAAAQQRT